MARSVSSGSPELDAWRRAHADALTALRLVLPLAEAYLKDAPGHPDNAKLEDARAVLRGERLLAKGSK